MKVGDLVRDKYWRSPPRDRATLLIGVIVSLPPTMWHHVVGDIAEVLVKGKIRLVTLSRLEVISESR